MLQHPIVLLWAIHFVNRVPTYSWTELLNAFTSTSAKQWFLSPDKLPRKIPALAASVQFSLSSRVAHTNPPIQTARQTSCSTRSPCTLPPTACPRVTFRLLPRVCMRNKTPLFTSLAAGGHWRLKSLTHSLARLPVPAAQPNRHCLAQQGNTCCAPLRLLKLLAAIIEHPRQQLTLVLKWGRVHRALVEL